MVCICVAVIDVLEENIYVSAKHVCCDTVAK